ncbi:MAG: menaquinone biosynthetic enzyme MqnA/MqnD family protein [Bryobacteraceae bacterium]
MERIRVCAVSYLNTVPLVWGLLHGRQKGLFDISFRIPAECADEVASGAADIGIIPIFELLRQQLGVVPGVGIACRGEVRSILLVTKCAPEEIRTLAADSSSRTSVALARIVLARRYGARPRFVSHAPDVPGMLRVADAALIIGDPALRVDPAALPWRTYDLGVEWLKLTGLPMVFAVWAGAPARITPDVVRAFQDSCEFGMKHLEEIVRQESAARGFSPEMVRHYLTSNLVLRFGDAEREGMRAFLEMARPEVTSSPSR